MKIQSISPLGAEISGIDLSSKVDELDIKNIKKAFLDNLVLIFRNQKLRPNELLSAAKLWGSPQIHPVFKGSESFPEIIRIENLGEKYHTNAHWHSDVTFEAKPPDATILYALDIPSVGGNTFFSNQYLAYDHLDLSLKDKLENYHARHSNKSVLQLVGADTSLEKSVLHPIFRTHPETNMKALYVTEAFVKKIEELKKQESEATLKKLYSVANNKKFQYEHRWRNGDMVVWDNRCVQHYAVHDHGDKTRTLNRITVEGSRPY